MEFVVMTSTILGGASTLLNGLFFVFILIFPPYNLGRYKSNYFIGAFANFGFALTQSVCAFTFISDGSLLLYVSLRRMGHFVLFLFMAAHNSLFIVIAYNFVHRYALISNNRKLLWVHDRKYLIRSLNVIWFALTIMPTEVILHVDESIRTLASQRYGATYGMFSVDFFYALSVERPRFGWEMAPDLSCMLFVAFGGWNIAWMIFSGISIYRFIKSKSKSEKLRRVNLRLLCTLSCQAILSLLFVYMPGLICVSSLIARKDISKSSLYLSSAMSCGTLFNPIIEFILTSEYRQKIVLFCGRGKVRKAQRVEFIAQSRKASLSYPKLCHADSNRYRKMSMPDNY